MQLGALPDDSTPWMMVVGVVGNVKQSLVTDMPTEMYVPYRQANEVLPVQTMSVVMRTEADPRLLIPDLRETVRRTNPDQPVVRIRAMEENVAQNFSQPQFRALLLLIFAGVALVIAAVGVYGVMAYSTAQRSGEMAIRMALGCSVERIFTLVLRDGLRLTLIGGWDRDRAEYRAGTLVEVAAVWRLAQRCGDPSGRGELRFRFVDWVIR